VSNEQNGRVALVTGTSRGIGAAIAAHLLEAGYRVAGTSRTGTAPEGVLGIACDITDPEQVDAAYQRIEAELGPVEVLVANAGVTRDGLMAMMKDEAWQEVIDTNLSGTFRTVRRAVRPMTRARFGRIVLISSVSAYVGTPGQVNYAASKAGLIGMARSVAGELGSRNITCNVVAPGFVRTDMTEELSDDVKADYLKRIPLRRAAEVDDIAAAVRFLCSDEAGYITGVVLPVDGGIGMGR